MEKTIHLPSPPILPPQIPKPPPNPSLKIPQKPPKISQSHLKSPPFLEKMLFLDSMGIDFLSLLSSHPSITSSSLPHLRASLDFLLSLGFSPAALRRLTGMCPDLLTCRGGAAAFQSVLNFLLEEVGVQSSDLCHTISRRPRLLVSNLDGRLRPTLRFLQKLGIFEIARHAHLLSCGVEEKFVPRLEFLRRAGFSCRDARGMARRFPQLFCYSVEGNLEPKLEFFVGVMGRELREIGMFPQCFSFSLERRIKKRYWLCEENAVFFELPALLKPSDEEFVRRLEVCVGSSVPLRKSPLWKEGLRGDCL